MNSSSSHERQILNVVPGVPGPRRVRTDHPGGSGRFPTVREIHKNAWLKRLCAPDKKGTPFIKKYDKHWVIFCVHDDAEALLEFYTEPKLGAAHKPNFTISLNTCLHVSPSIIGQDNEYEFVITLPNQVIRLIAANWDQMIEWVESLQGKLREMNILNPKDNVYSKLPDTQGYNCPGLRLAPGIVTTRDPNSPLPPPPVNANGVPSILSTEASRANPSRSREIPNTDSNPVEGNPSQPNGLPGVRKKRKERAADRQNSVNHHRDVETASTSTAAVERGIAAVQVNANSSATENTVTQTPALSEQLEEDKKQENYSSGEAVACSRPVVVVNGGASTSNTSVVQITGCEHAISSVSVNSNLSSSNRTCPNTEVAESVASNAVAVLTSPVPVSNVSPMPNSSKNEQNGSSAVQQTSAPVAQDHPQYAVPIKRSSSSENVYEHLFVSSTFANRSNSSKPLHTGNQSDVPATRAVRSDHDRDQNTPPVIPHRSRHQKSSSRSSTATSFQRSSSLGRLDQQGNSQDSSDCTTPDAQNHRGHGSNRHHNGKHSSRSREHESGLLSGSAVPAGVLPNRPSNSEFRPMEAMIGVRSGEYRIRRDDVPVVGTSVQAKSDIDRSHLSSSPNVPLKEQQVMRLKAEIQHPVGVRIVLRKKDCVNSIAFIDYLGAVWIAGWKQQQHPVLYYAFHVGDQVVKIAGVTVQNSAEAQRAIKMVSSMQVEFIIRRLPYGRVLVLKRSRDGEPLGIAIESNSGEIGDVVPGGLAAKQGLPPHTIAADGKSSCNWFLTEINNRPLSLLAKESEVKERLNAVGKEISILVQPADLVKHLRKQLKSVKGFKEYLVV